MQGVTAGYSSNGTLLWEGFSKLPTVWATALPNGDVCATGGYDALITCWRPSGSVPPNQPPTAVMSATPSSGAAPLTVTFSSAGSSDPDGTITAYAWNFGDGNTSNQANPSHAYSAAGTYVASLTVTDNAGATATASTTITVTPATVPTLRSTAINLTATRNGSRVTVSGQVVVRDAANAAVSGVSVNITWRKPDGTTVTQTATTGSSGNASFNSSGGRGTYTLTVNNLTKTGYTFDPAHSVLSKSITK
jgi:PKD repeat protein